MAIECPALASKRIRPPSVFVICYLEFVCYLGFEIWDLGFFIELNWFNRKKLSIYSRKMTDNHKNIYLELTDKFNEGRTRAIICSGQAVVLHRLAIMSKDGDWILREDAETLSYILGVLNEYGAKYRFGAPLDLRWMAGGWSSHFEFRRDGLRVRADFFTLPPRISPEALKNIWAEQEGREPPYLDIVNLAELKKTNRERDYAVIGELARRMTDPGQQLLYSRSARDLMQMAENYPGLVKELVKKRLVLKSIPEGLERLEEELDKERRYLIHANEARLSKYIRASERWSTIWPDLEIRMRACSLLEAHELMVKSSEGVLPFDPEGAV